jgi:hypothetical protein
MELLVAHPASYGFKKKKKRKAKSLCILTEITKNAPATLWLNHNRLTSMEVALLINLHYLSMQLGNLHMGADHLSVTQG